MKLRGTPKSDPDIHSPDEQRVFQCTDGTVFETFKEAEAYQAWVDFRDWLADELEMSMDDAGQLATLIRHGWNVTPKDE